MTVDDLARRIADDVAGDGGLAGLRRLSGVIATLEDRRTVLVEELRRGRHATWEEIGRACGMTRQGATRRWSGKLRARSFGAAASAYQQGRPGYPQALIGSVVSREARRVLDLGAGTGKLTRLLVDAGLDVVAVEPDEAMRDQLAAAVPKAAVRAGSAERIPLADGSVDAVVVAQAWHWFDQGAAVPEIARVLAPGGTLALVWNVRDESEPWAAALGALMHRSTRQVIDTQPVVPAPFGAPERLEIRWQHVTTRAEIVDMVASRSYVIALPEAERARLLADVEELLATHPDLAGRDEIAMPYITRCTRVSR
ncbi:methyltransferase domain-containing protein [Streptomyces kaniharaensis]|uniref:Methyltransferase domain-containing protein n=1 Tax=Streptomyces kaniharaensis TaxID=212423 RepID=A0A6N7L4U5_9ACTN|nr:class I SAM-dependent methyltransferase [Streptomyces kaniharaensis]MQS16923.1 methyltransferase domain-containing protein [Streptomyces kaniharaensis]